MYFDIIYVVWAASVSLAFVTWILFEIWKGGDDEDSGFGWSELPCLRPGWIGSWAT